MTSRQLRYLPVALTIVAALAGCTSHRDDDTALPASAAPPMPASTPPAVSAPVGAPGLFPAPSDTTAPPAVVTASPITVVIPVPPLPADLSPARPPAGPTATADDHDHDSESAATASDVAVAWIVALYTARYDDPAGLVAEQIAALAAPAVAARAVGELAPIDVERAEARWPIVTAVSATAGGGWRVEFVIKRTQIGQVGPSTSALMMVDVTVVDGHVTGWNSVEVAS